MGTGGSPARQSVIRFGEFELDLSRQTLSRRGIRLKLRNQPCQVLALLIRRAPEVVSRDGIRRQVWGDNVYIDFERNINFCIRQIRGVLLDNAGSPHFIETLPREGYRFIAPLAYIGEPEIAQPPDSKPGKEAMAGDFVKPKQRRWLIVLIAAGIFAVVAFWLMRRDLQIKVTGLSPVTSYPGDEREPPQCPKADKLRFPGMGKMAAATST